MIFMENQALEDDKLWVQTISSIFLWMRCMYHDDEIVMVKDLLYDMLNWFMHFI